jgi:hypothetical protein
VFWLSVPKARASWSAHPKQFLQQKPDSVRRARITSARCNPAWHLPHISVTCWRNDPSVRQHFSFGFFLNAAHWFFAPFLGRPTP